MHQLFKDFKKAHSSVRRDVLFDILNVFCIPIKPVRLMKICLDEIYSSIVGKQLSDIFPLRNVLEKVDNLLPLFFNFAVVYDSWVQKNQMS